MRLRNAVDRISFLDGITHLWTIRRPAENRLRGKAGIGKCLRSMIGGAAFGRFTAHRSGIEGCLDRGDTSFRKNTLVTPGDPGYS